MTAWAISAAEFAAKSKIGSRGLSAQHGLVPCYQYGEIFTLNDQGLSHHFGTAMAAVWDRRWQELG